MNTIKTFLSERKADILALITLTTAFLSLKSFIDTDTQSYINAIAAVLLLGTTAISFGVRGIRAFKNKR